jgi:hypothetical protein
MAFMPLTAFSKNKLRQKKDKLALLHKLDISFGEHWKITGKMWK